MERNRSEMKLIPHFESEIDFLFRIEHLLMTLMNRAKKRQQQQNEMNVF